MRLLSIFALCIACFYAGWLLRSTVKPAGPVVAYGSLAGYRQEWAAPPDEHTLFYVIPADSIEVVP